MATSSDGADGAEPGGGESTPPFLHRSSLSTSVDGDADVDTNDLEALSSKACEFASTPVPDYTGQIQRANERSKKKHGDRFIIDDKDVDITKDLKKDKDGIALAERTSQILSDFQEYVSGIGGDAVGSGAAKEILEGKKSDEAEGPPRSVATLTSAPDVMGGSVGDHPKTSVASNIRDDNKALLLEKKEGSSATPGRSIGSGGKSPSKNNLQREWSYGEGYMDVGDTKNLHDLAGTFAIDDWEDPENGRVSSDDIGSVFMVARGQRYTHPLLQSKRVRLGLLNCIVVVAVVFGVSIAVTGKDKEAGQELEDKVDELEEELAEKGGLVMEGAAAVQGGQPAQQPATSHPYEIKLPPGGVDQATFGRMPQQPPELNTEEELTAFHDVMAKYEPMEYDRFNGWYGSSYPDAYDFCGHLSFSDDAIRYEICPYEVVCPWGPNKVPLSGYKQGTWMPISDNPNDWAQLGHESPCFKYSDEHEYPPDWGGDRAEGGYADETSHVMCCLSQTLLDGIDHSDAVSTLASSSLPGGIDDPTYPLYASIAKHYQPLHFDRLTGWNGRTYKEATEFCNRVDKGYGVCPYDVICVSFHWC